MDVFDFFKEYKLENNVFINIIEITEITDSLRKLMDENLSIICEGKPERDIKIIKKALRKTFKSKQIIWQMGAIAEFFIHLIINLMEYKQECLFINLEENQIKKGFDGLYTKNDEMWIMESKAGSIDTKNITHKKKLQEAINDLKFKFSNKTKNNPWRNAYHHASVIEFRNYSILKKIEKLSDDYIDDKEHSIDEFNVIPSATIFFNDMEFLFKEDMIFLEIKNLIEKFKFKKAHIICISQKSINLFKKYIEIEE